MSQAVSGPHAQGVQSNSVFDLPGKSARIVQKYWKLFALVNLPGILLAVMGMFGDDDINDQAFSGLNTGEWAMLVGFGAVAVIIFILVSLFFQVMTLRLSLDAINNRPVTAKGLVDIASKHWLRLFGLVVLMILIIGVGLILLIIPGIIAAVFLSLAPIILIDKNTSVVDALKGSYNMVNANVGAVLSALLVIIGLGIVASVVKEIPVFGPLLGTIISIAFSLILFLRYQEIKNRSKASSQA